MTGQELYDFLGALSEEERKREIKVYDGGCDTLRPFDKIRLQDPALKACFEIIVNAFGWYEPSEFMGFKPCVVLIDKRDFYDVSK